MTMFGRVAAWLIALPILLAGCHPSGMASDMASQEEVGRIELLSPTRRLPPSAVNVRLDMRHARDSSLRLRFDAPLGQAMAFAEELVGAFGTGDGSVPPQPDLDWWPKTVPEAAKLAQGRAIDGKGQAQVEIILLPRGNRATVWLHLFTT